MSLFQRIFVILSGFAFLALMLSPLSGLFNQSSEPQSNAKNPKSAPPEQQLKNVAKGYEQVLKREPENPVALQGLAEARLQLRDLKGSIEPLEKLSKLYPEQKELKTLLEKIKKQVIAQEKSDKLPPIATPQPPSEGKNSPIPSSPIPSSPSLPYPSSFPTPTSSPTPTFPSFPAPTSSPTPTFPSFPAPTSTPSFP